ncbi:MAG: mechanosensitive ion channel [Candidatus Marithrix sp.]
MRIMLVLCIIISWLIIPLSASSETVNSPKINYEIPKFHILSNTKLLKQAKTTFNNTSGKFKTELRGVVINEKLLEQAREKTASLSLIKQPIISPANQPQSILPSSKIIKLNLERTKNRLNKFKKLFRMVTMEKILLEQQIVQIKTTLLAANSFSNKIKYLNILLLEIKLRIDDGTLLNNEVPDFLSIQAIENKQQILIEQQVELNKKNNKTKKELNKIIGYLAKIKNDILKIEINYNSIKTKYNQELRRKKIEQEYLTQNSKTLLLEMSKLQKEWLWINGNFNLLYRKFTNHKKNVIFRLEQEIAKMSLVNIQKFQITQAEEIQQAVKTAEKLTTHNTSLIIKLWNLQKNLRLFIEYGKSIEVEAIVLNNHIFKMQIIAKILENFVKAGEITIAEIPEINRYAKLIIVTDNLSIQLTNALINTKKAKKQLIQVTDEIEKYEFSQKEIREKLANLKKVYESIQKMQQWKAKLKNLTTGQIVVSFQNNTKKIAENQLFLQKIREAFNKTKVDVKKTKLNLSSLKEPLLRLVQQESIAEKEVILKKLYQFAKLKLLAKNIKIPEKTLEINKTLAEKPLKIIDYQNLLASRTRIIKKQQEQRIELSKKLNYLIYNIEQYINILSETRKTESQHYSNALELKKLMGLGKLNDDEVLENIIDILQSKIISQLNKDITRIINYKINIKQQIKNLNQQDETIIAIQNSLIITKNLTAKRIDISLKWQKLKESFERKRNELSETELKTIEQTAIRRIEAEDNIIEFFLGFIPSKRAESLSNLMYIYYLELIELEKKQENIRAQRIKIKILTKLAQQEKPIIRNLLPLLQKHKDQLELKKAEELAKIKIQLMPEKADEILNEFETKTGYRIAMPASILKEHKVNIIKKATNLIFDLHIQIIAIDKWFNLFEQRLSTTTGIDEEIGNYQDKLGILNDENYAIQYRIQYIIGNSVEQSSNNADELNLLNGEIGELRLDIYKIRTQATLQVIIKLTLILLITIFITWVTNKLVNRTLSNANRLYKKQTFSLLENKPVGTFIILLPLLRTIFIFIVWISAIILGLSILGFNAGTVLAGLGIGGLAVAMASQKTLSDIIGGISILIAGSFKIGDIILYNNQPGKIEDISLRYTRIRESVTDYLHTVPNSLLAEKQLTNISAAEPGVHLTMSLPLSIDNSAEQLKLAIQIVTEIIKQNPYATLKWIRFHSFETYAFTIKSNFGVQWEQKNIVQTDLYTEIVRQFQQHNIKFAYPI